MTAAVANGNHHEQEKATADNSNAKFIDTIDPDAPEYQRQLRRPAEVKEDVRQMEQRQRVSLVMKTQAFRDQLENIVTETMRSGSCPASLFPLQQISTITLPSSYLSQTASLTRAIGPVIPISDIHGSDAKNYTKSEKQLRCKLASCHRTLDMFGWSSSMNSLITARINQDTEQFLVIPRGLLYHEVTAASLSKVGMSGEMLDSGSTNFGVDEELFALHATLHAGRPDVKCVIHLQHSHALSVSAMKCGLLMICPEAFNVGEVTYVDYEGREETPSEVVTRALGPVSKVLILKNYGIAVCGRSVEEAHYLAVQIMKACTMQVSCMPAGIENLFTPSEETRRRAQEVAARVAKVSANGGGSAGDGTAVPKWRRGEIEFEALMRHLDNAGFRTGHVYRESLYKKSKVKDQMSQSIEIPPSSSSLGDMYDESLISPLKHHIKKQQRCEWLNAPNNYKKEELDETGTLSPKKYIRWVTETDPSGGNSIRIEDPNMFAPQGSNPKELKQKVIQIRKDYYEDNINAGPQSKILDGDVTWDEQREGDITVMVGAASKGIIQRDHQHNAAVFKQTYATNPFANVNNEEDVTQKFDNNSSAKISDHTELNESSEGAPKGVLVSSNDRLNKSNPAQEAKTYTETCIDDMPISEDNTHPEPQSTELSPSISFDGKVDTSTDSTHPISSLATSNYLNSSILTSDSETFFSPDTTSDNTSQNTKKLISSASFLNSSSDYSSHPISSPSMNSTMDSTHPISDESSHANAANTSTASSHPISSVSSSSATLTDESHPISLDAKYATLQATSSNASENRPDNNINNNNKLSRSESARLASGQQKPKSVLNFLRSRSERGKKNKKDESKPVVSSPAKSSSSGELLEVEGTSSKSKKKNKFRIPSFTSKKKDKKSK